MGIISGDINVIYLKEIEMIIFNFVNDFFCLFLCYSGEKVKARTKPLQELEEAPIKTNPSPWKDTCIFNI